MGEACSTCGGEERCIMCFEGETWGGRGQLEDTGIDGRIILR